MEVLLGRKEGLSVRSAANLDNIHVVSKASLAGRAGRLGSEREPEVKRALGYALGWPELKVLEEARPRAVER